MDEHRGQIVEYIVRKNECSLADLSQALKTNRRTLYNWFKQPKLHRDIILRIGVFIGHDFAIEFPSLFNPGEYHVALNATLPISVAKELNQQNKRVMLLEHINEPHFKN